MRMEILNILSNPRMTPPWMTPSNSISCHTAISKNKFFSKYDDVSVFSSFSPHSKFNPSSKLSNMPTNSSHPGTCCFFFFVSLLCPLFALWETLSFSYSISLVICNTWGLNGGFVLMSVFVSWVVGFFMNLGCLAVIWFFVSCLAAGKDSFGNFFSSFVSSAKEG